MSSSPSKSLEDHAVLFDEGLTSFRAKDFAGAEKCFREAAAQASVDSGNLDKTYIAKIRSNQAVAQIRLGNFSDAVESSRQCIQLRPDWAKGYFRLANALNGLQETKKAFKAAVMAKAFAKHDERVYADMYRSLKETLQDGEAAELEAELAHLLPHSAMQLSGQEGKREEDKMPVMVLSGFLGAGKTTTLLHILTNRDGLRIAVIVNDMSEVNVDVATIKHFGEVEVTCRSEKLIELSNGCICCTLRDDLLDEIIRISTEESENFDYILIESTGISEPIPVAQTFLFEDIQGRSLSNVARLDAMITVVDGSSVSHELSSLETLKDRDWEASERDSRSIVELMVDQIEFANIVIINKQDLMSDDEKSTAKSIIKALNPGAQIFETEQGKVSLDEILKTGLFKMQEAAISAGWLRELRDTHTPENEEYGISSFVFRSESAFDGEKLASLIAEGNFFPSMNVIRGKGVCWIKEDPRFVLDFALAGRRTTLAAKGFWKMPKTEMVFIGIELRKEELETRLNSIIADSAKLESAALSFEEQESLPHFALVEDLLGALKMLGADKMPVSELSKETQSTAIKASAFAKRLNATRDALDALAGRAEDLTEAELHEAKQLSQKYTDLMLESGLIPDESSRNHLVQNQAKLLHLLSLEQQQQQRQTPNP